MILSIHNCFQCAVLRSTIIVLLCLRTGLMTEMILRVARKRIMDGSMISVSAENVFGPSYSEVHTISSIVVINSLALLFTMLVSE